jgi:predicted esterase
VNEAGTPARIEKTPARVCLRAPQRYLRRAMWRTTLTTGSLALAVAALGLGDVGVARAGDKPKFTLAALPYQPVWCAEEMEPLGREVCHVPGTPSPDGRRTLVIFLHGVIAKNTMWQWLQERVFGRVAKELHFDAIFPQAPRVGRDGAGGFAWPGLVKGEGEGEQALVDGWLAAKQKLEEKNGRPFDEVYVAGFSSGAYFATQLALHAKLAIDGYIVMAGGAPSDPSAEATGAKRVPVFIGVCARDNASAPAARQLGTLLRGKSWPVRVDEQPFGHGVSDVHVAHALAWFRARRAPAAK